MMRGRAMSAPAPTAAPSRDEQFEQARKAAEQRSATSLGAASAQVNEVMATSGASVPARNVNGRTFAFENGRWTDTRFSTSLRVTKIKSYSKAYFALLDQAPELREMFALGERVVVAGKTAAVEVAEDGREELSSGELQQLLRDLGLRS
jgi:hypothetical protein